MGQHTEGACRPNYPDKLSGQGMRTWSSLKLDLHPLRPSCTGLDLISVNICKKYAQRDKHLKSGPFSIPISMTELAAISKDVRPFCTAEYPEPSVRPGRPDARKIASALCKDSPHADAAL